ncbi:hypothetical protein HBHAL_2591 [Halobacillus halophilus DSM 2266]|uniref:Holin-like toxin n=1 Tax=Halobacillus halophilus (strain ATCC 35676 / DSM 2266 / JCM 20832 / KCTC 3685 / LMG 17431 / NBRC 102448 / NCIMB 2269) TaxID=866895 RepID=I0JLB7_HALH3|nr:hypothetical protein HBHAL_2591 [Halobacillus halophilus DSM 2266]
MDVSTLLTSIFFLISLVCLLFIGIVKVYLDQKDNQQR